MKCEQCATLNAADAVQCRRCGVTFPAASERWSPTAGSSSGQEHFSDGIYAEFWRRGGAFVLDTLIIWVLQFAIVVPLLISGGERRGLAALVASYVLAGIYKTAFQASRLQATPGKLAFGLKVTTLAGQRLGLGRALGRYLGEALSGLMLLVGYLLAAFTARRQALHDMLAGTLVVRRDREPIEIAHAGRARPY